MSTKKSFLIVSLIILLIMGICGTAEAIDNRPRVCSRSGVHITSMDVNDPSTRQLHLSNPYWDFTLDAAGYSDDLNWWISPRPHVTGEMLSGEWGAAIYYEDINTAPIDPYDPNGRRQAMWLTNKFIDPDWETNSDFQIFQNPNAWDDPCNPVDGIDTGYSVIKNGQVEVRIDYEMVDLGMQGPNGEGGSPLAFRDANGTPVFVYSERYVLLQTYTIKNIKTSGNVTGLEFYQMLSGYWMNLSAYETSGFYDPLANYVPHNSVHKVGNFHYDITQWDSGYNNWIGFSSTAEPNVEPNSFDNGPYWAHSGTALRIEERSLNGELNGYSYDGYVGGATGWYLGSLEPNESVSRTVVIMVGAGKPGSPCPLTLKKVDDVNDGDCVGPGDEINYRIDYNYPGGPNCPDINDVNIIDELPGEVEFISASGYYNRPDANTVVWNIGTLHPGDAGFVTLKVKVRCAERGGTIANCCRIKSGEKVRSIACEDTPVCSPTLTKVDNITGCVSPGDDVNYSICYAANGYGDTNVVIIDELPPEVNYISSDPCGVYNPGSHKVTWHVNFPPDACDCIELVVKVNTKAEPGGKIRNCCKMRGSCMTNPVTACEETNVCCWHGTVIHVDADATGNNDGTSWRDAYNYLQDAFEAARGLSSGGCSPCPCADIRVAEGTYRPDQNSVYPNGTRERTATFGLINGVEIYGGYAGLGEPNQPDPNARDIRQYKTILSGDLKGNDRQDVDPCDLLGDPCRADNSYHVVTGSGTYETAVLDGFTITGGNADSNDSYRDGGGMYNDDGSPTVRNCTFRWNSARYDGGGIYTASDTNGMIARNCAFIGNAADYGGGMYNSGNGITPVLTNCTFSGNWAKDGGGIYNTQHYSCMTVTNCILWDNEGGQILGGCVTVTYSDIEGGWREGKGNIEEDPMLEADGYHLTLCSPGINAGDPNYVAGLGETDIDGETRIVCGRVDMGADERNMADCNEPLHAYCPSHSPKPACGETDVPRDVNLSWAPGPIAFKHDIYFGTNETKVTDANRASHPGLLWFMLNVGSTRPVTIYNPAGLLDLDTTYYWRVDDVNSPSNILKGNVWYFMVRNYLVVDDFEQYSVGVPIDSVWYSDPVYACLNTDANFVRDGNQSMKYLYSGYAEVDAWTGGDPYEGELLIGPDWTEQGVKALTLYFYGDPCNAVLPMYVKLEDSSHHTGTVHYGDQGEDLNDLKVAGWHEWDIALADFGVVLTHVTDVYLGFGAGAGSGTLYFDDIRLYRPRCVPSLIAGNFDNDCDVDYDDLAVMAKQWLVGDYNANPLMAWYKLDGNAVDSSGHGNHGTVYGDPNWGTVGHIGTAIDLNGIHDYVDCSNDVNLNITYAITLAAWVKTRDCNNSQFNPYVVKGDYSYGLQHKNNNTIEFFIYDAGAWYTASLAMPDANLNGAWHHLAGTYDGSKLKLYIDGVMKATTAHIGFIDTDTYNVNLGRESQYPDRLYNGLIDDVRIYDKALSQAEIMSIMAGGLGSVSNYHPLTSPANLYKVGPVVINFKDFAVLADNWLKELWP